MSFLKIKDQNKRDETVKEFLELRNRIKDNFHQERIGEIEMQSNLSKFFKPVTETQKATAKEITEQLKPIREGIEGIEGATPQKAIAFPAFPSIELPPEDIIRLGPVAVKALKKPFTKEGVDLNFWLYDKDGEFYIGDKPAVIKDNNIIVDGNEYLGTPGLWELILSKKPKNFNDEDFKKYEDLLRRTNAIYHGNNPNQNRAKGNYRGSKWTCIV